MKVCIIGGTGHIGGFLTPMLVEQGWEVTVMARGKSAVAEEGAWKRVQRVQAAYKVGDAVWAEALRKAAPEVLIDILGADLAASYDAVAATCKHVVACGSVWMLGKPRRVPFTEQTKDTFWGEGYARRWAVIHAVMNRSQAGQGPPLTAILPPNICGPGKIPLDTEGGRSIDVHRRLAAGYTVSLPDGPDALIGPCDAEDIANAFKLAVLQPQRCAGEILNVGSGYALTASEFVAAYGQIYGVEIPIRRVGWKEFAERIVPDPGARYHFESHMCPDITKIRQKLGYEPKYTPEQTMRRAVEWMKAQKMLPEPIAKP